MYTVTTITPKFQVHIPTQIRKKLNLTRHGRARVSTRDNKIIIEPLKDEFLSLGGSFSVSNSTPAEHIRKHIDYTAGKK